MWSFCWHHCLWDIILSPQLLYSSTSTSSPSLVSCAYILRIPWMVPMSTYPHSTPSSVSLFTLDLNFTSSVITSFPPYFSSPFPSLSSSPCFLFTTLLCLLTIFLFQLYIFCKMSHGFTTGRQGGNTTAIHTFLCMWICEQLLTNKSPSDFKTSDLVHHGPWHKSIIN